MSYFCPSTPSKCLVPAVEMPDFTVVTDVTTLTEFLSASIAALTLTEVVIIVVMFGPHVLLLFQLIGALRRASFKKVSGAILGYLRAAVPGVGALVEAQVQKELKQLEDEMHGDGDAEAIFSMPAKGTPAAKLEKTVAKMRDSDPFVTKAGKLWGGIYHEAESELTTLQATVWKHYNTSNALYPKEFPSLRTPALALDLSAHRTPPRLLQTCISSLGVPPQVRWRRRSSQCVWVRDLPISPQDHPISARDLAHISPFHERR